MPMPSQPELLMTKSVLVEEPMTKALEKLPAIVLIAKVAHGVEEETAIEGFPDPEIVRAAVVVVAVPATVVVEI